MSHCPESNLKLASGVAPIPELLAAGVTVSLGTDGAGSNNNLDLWGELSLAARLHKVWRRDPTPLPAALAVALATREGAQVLGLGGATGTLTAGKAADLIVVDLNQPHLTPLYEPFSHLAYAARAADVRHVMAQGRWLLFERQFRYPLKRHFIELPAGKIDAGEDPLHVADGGDALHQHAGL